MDRTTRMIFFMTAFLTTTTIVPDKVDKVHYVMVPHSPPPSSSCADIGMNIDIDPPKLNNNNKNYHCRRAQEIVMDAAINTRPKIVGEYKLIMTTTIIMTVSITQLLRLYHCILV